MSLLDAATNDLAQLINRLDLEATPGSRDISPRSARLPLEHPESKSPRRHTVESPIKSLRAKVASIASLRPYAQSSSKVGPVQIGQNIAPWSTLNASISPSKPSPATIRAKSGSDVPTIRMTHKRTPTPAPAVDPPPVFKALRPATNRLAKVAGTVRPSSAVSPFIVNADEDRSPSTLTFGSNHSPTSFSASPVFRKAQGHVRKSSSLAPIQSDDNSLPIPPEARRNLGLNGTMGGSIGSIAEQEFDASDPDSDIPDELQVILSNSDQEDTISFDPKVPYPPLPSPGLPPEVPLPIPVPEVPVFRARVIDEDDHQADIEEAAISSEDDTKKSFDFTGEIKKLNESGASHRRSFVEQLEHAFRTPAKIDLHYDFGNFLTPDVPPSKHSLQDELSMAGDTTFNWPSEYESRDLSPMDFPLDVNAEPSLLPGTDSYAASDDDLLSVIAPQMQRKPSSVVSRPSDGELNRDFKFGGKPSPSPIKEDASEDAPLTLSDIIPPPAFARSLSTGMLAPDDSALMNSIYAKAVEISSPQPRTRFNSDASTRGILPGSVKAHHRNSSALSFGGLDSFAEIRRGFEFNDSRPGFYPPTTTSRHDKRESMLSIASVSSYGHLVHSGSSDPFDYASLALPSKQRPWSDDFSSSMSTSVDDTFSFIHKLPRRKRVDSDASSFYFRSPGTHNRSHRRHDSAASITSIVPPVSLYNRGFGHHRRGDSSTSISSMAQTYAMGGANGGRASWAKHRPEFSVDSILSNYSGARLGRPGLGDKMLESAFDYGTPLTAISASPPESLAGSIRNERITSGEFEYRTTYDSIMDSRNEPQKTTVEDSIFEKTGHRTSVSSSDSTFFGKNSEGHDPPRYRPISSFSIASLHGPVKENDTMISVSTSAVYRELF